jgi:hypothetical protein
MVLDGTGSLPPRIPGPVGVGMLFASTRWTLRGDPAFQAAPGASGKHSGTPIVSNFDQRMQDVTDATGRQVLDDIFEESRMLRTKLVSDLAPAQLAGMTLPQDPYIGFYHGTIDVDGKEFSDGDTLVVGSETQQRRYLLKRWEGGRRFKAYQVTPVENEKLRLLNVYRVMLGQLVSA